MLIHWVLQATLLRGFVQKTVHFGKKMYVRARTLNLTYVGPWEMCLASLAILKRRERGVTSNSKVNVHKTG